MTQEHKELLLKDLCGRLPYGVKIKTPSDFWTSEEGICELKEIFKGGDGLFRIGDIGALIEYSKPYLFPLSSMTEEQRKEYESLCVKETSECTDLYGIIFTKDYYYDTVESIDYLYKNHIDIRGLIPMGLAEDATKLDIY